ncbi:MAG: aminotransferase class I/II-fold pyridoxal phosphate-dependent enzyme [Phycisphaeraceae bacterium]|nr:aminotransferase class I/II-fold pyridoxal phosphate-dependent enzyme [Phycisphaeraceae bacterium]
MNELAKELNQTIMNDTPSVHAMLSSLGRELFYPKGILSQTAEAKQKAIRFNATVGIAKQGGQAMYLPSVMSEFSGLGPDQVLPYAPVLGLPGLRQQWKLQMIHKNPSLGFKRVSLPLVTSGLTHGLSLAADLFVDPGDVVLLPDMAWGNYNMIFGVRKGARIERFVLFADEGGFNQEDFRRSLLRHADHGKVIVVLNFPNNPTGYSLTKAEARAVVGTLREVAEGGCHVVAICDDAYFGLFYEKNLCRESLFTYLAGCDDRLLAVKLDGATKEDYVWGLRVGFMTFATGSGSVEVYETLEKKTGGAIRGSLSNCAHPSQSILLRAMRAPDYQSQRQQKYQVLEARALSVKRTLSDERFDEVWTPYPFNSGYFMCIKLRDIDAEQYRCRLLDEYGVGVIATGLNDIRIAFSCIEESDIQALFEVMYECALLFKSEV